MEAPIEHHSIVISHTSHGGFQLVMGVPPHGWSTKEKNNLKWMMFLGVPPFLETLIWASNG